MIPEPFDGAHAAAFDGVHGLALRRRQPLALDRYGGADDVAGDLEHDDEVAADDELARERRAGAGREEPPAFAPHRNAIGIAGQQRAAQRIIVNVLTM